MKVEDLRLTDNLVRADSKEAENGFRYKDDPEEKYGYYVPVSDNSMNLYIRRAITDRESIFIRPKDVLVFNVNFNSTGIVEADQMVEPVNMMVQVID